MFDDEAQVFDGVRDVPDELRSSEVEGEVSVGAERLHQSLARAPRENVVGGFEAGVTLAQGPVKSPQMLALVRAEEGVRVEKERGHIVFGTTRPQPLVIDEKGLAVANDHVLRLKIAVDEESRE